MSKILTNAIDTDGTLTLGASGDSVTIPSGAILKTNKILDSGGNNIVTSDGSGALTLNSAMAGDFSLLNTSTFVDQASTTFTTSITGFNSTYNLYLFKVVGCFPVDDAGGATLKVGFSDDAGSSYTTTKTTTLLRIQREFTGSAYSGSVAVANAFTQSAGTGDAVISSADNDDTTNSWNGDMWLWTPSSTTYYKTFTSSILGQYVTGGGDNTAYWELGNGYIGGLSVDIDAVKFYSSDGNISGTVKLYGVA